MLRIEPQKTPGSPVFGEQRSEHIANASVLTHLMCQWLTTFLIYTFYETFCLWLDLLIDEHNS